MHHGTHVKHVPWCMPWWLTGGFFWNRWRGNRSQDSRRMHNPEYYVSGKRPISDKTSHHKISWSLEAARLAVWIIASRCCRCVCQVSEQSEILNTKLAASRSYDKTSYRTLIQCPGCCVYLILDTLRCKIQAHNFRSRNKASQITGNSKVRPS